MNGKKAKMLRQEARRRTDPNVARGEEYGRDPETGTVYALGEKANYRMLKEAVKIVGKQRKEKTR